MPIFSLVTDALTSAGSTINSLVSQVDNVASNVKGYDTSCEDGFDFDSAKNVIAQNLDACAIKVQNTATVLDTVVNSHTQLQNKMEFPPSESTNKSKNSTNSSNDGNSSGGYGGGSSGGYGGGSSGGYGGSLGGGVYPSAVGVAAGAIPVVAQANTEEKKKEKGRISVVNTKIKSTGYAIVDKDVAGESKELLADSEFKYKDGYATIGDCFVVACDSSVGQVGDVLQFSQKDGTVVHAVIGVSTFEESNADKLHFLVDQNSKILKRSEACDNLIQNNKSIINFGSIYDIRDFSLVAKSVSGDTNMVSTIISGASTQNIQKNIENNKEGVKV